MSRDNWIRRGEHFPSGSPKSWMSQLYIGVNTACVSSGSPLPDGTPTQRGYVLLLAPYDSPTDILKARFQAAGGDPSHLQLVLPLVGDPSRDLAHTRPYAFPQDLDHLAAIIRSLDFCLVILDPASGIPGLSRCLPALVELARQTNCAILLTRSLRQSPVDPFHAPAPTSPLLQATSYDREAGRKMLLRMKMAGELVSPARGLYTTANHPCLLHFSNDTSP